MDYNSDNTNPINDKDELTDNTPSQATSGTASDVSAKSASENTSDVSANAASESTSDVPAKVTSGTASEAPAQKPSRIQPAVKKELGHISVYTGIGVVLTCAVFFVLHLCLPDDVPFDYTVPLGCVCGGLVAVLNFFLMGLTVQRVAAETDNDRAKKIMKLSYTRRLIMQILWIVVAIFAPCFQVIASVLPLLFPGLGIRISGVLPYIFKSRRK